MRKRWGGRRARNREQRLVEACFGNALWIEAEFDRRSQILMYPSLPQLASVGLDAFDAAWRLTERMDVVPPGWPSRVVRCRRSALA